MNWSRVYPDALRLTVDDMHFGQGLHDDYDYVSLTRGGLIVDLVNYDSSFAHRNDHTIERIAVGCDSSDPNNWTEGPLYGTPGRQNLGINP